MRKIAASILAADPKKMKEEIRLAELSGSDFIHIDIMDGKFVKNTTWTPDFVQKIRSDSPLFLDVHIMVEEPWIWGPLYAKAGADNVTFHLEACQDEKQVRETIRLIQEAGAKASLSIKPDTPVEAVYPYLDEVYLVLIMSVEPGEGGQSFLPPSIGRIAALKMKIAEKKSPLIEVDGGINEKTGTACFEAGADILVAGSYLFGHEDFATRLEGLKK